MFVVFEGIDGSGKTTISNRVAERLSASGLRVKHLRAGGEFASLVTQAIRELGRDARNYELEPTAEFLLYVARDVQLMHQVLRPALRDHDVVIADRFFYTAQVLAQHGRHLSEGWIKPILQGVTEGKEPDLVVLVDVDPKLARARRKASKLSAADKRPPSRKGLAGVGLQYRLRAGYLALAAESKGRWAVLENGATLEQAVQETTALILGSRNSNPAQALQQFHREQRAKRKESQVIDSVAGALSALVNWVDAHSENEPQVAAYIMGGLCGREVDARREALAARAPQAVLAALGGLDDPVSWQLRERLLGDHSARVARTLSGFPTQHVQAQPLRERLLPHAPAEVMQSLSGQSDEAAWALRTDLFAAYPTAVMLSLARLGSEQAWALRSQWFAGRGAQLGTDYETARVSLRSIQGLDDARAWHWRQVARAVAPVAALASIKGLSSDEAWQWRAEFLRYAPKVVMATVHRMQHPLAWPLRQQVAADCKEALDSISGLNDPEAWALRDQYCNTWPSTVVKSLGALADEARGQALVLAQLRAHPGNLSLLQHTSAIALGVHRHGLEQEE